MNYLILKQVSNYSSLRLEEAQEEEQDQRMPQKIYIDKHYYQEIGLN